MRARSPDHVPRFAPAASVPRPAVGYCRLLVLRRLRIENLVLIREADLTFAPGLNAVTGETGAGKTIFAQAIGLLLGARADASSVGSDGTEAYVEAELDVPDGFFDDEELAALAELRPEGEAGLVIARRVFGDGRTRAYAWGRAVAREDVAAAAERLIAMSGQFEQRRLARPSFQLDVLDAFCGAEQLERRREARVAWRELVAARRRHEELTRDADAVAFRLAELQALVEATEGMAADEEARLLARRERLRHVEELAEAATAAAAAIAPDEGEGAASLAALAERSLAPFERIAPELGATAEELRDLAVRLTRGRLATSTASSPRSTRSPVRSRRSRSGSRSSPTSSGASEQRPTRSSSTCPRAAERELGERRRDGRPGRGRGCRGRSRRRSASAASPPRSARRARRTPRPLGERRGGRARVARDGRRRVPRRAARARRRAQRAPTRRRSSCAPTPGSRSLRSRTPLRAASSPASRSRSRQSPEARRWSSTRSTPASAA